MLLAEVLLDLAVNPLVSGVTVTVVEIISDQSHSGPAMSAIQARSLRTGLDLELLAVVTFVLVWARARVVSRESSLGALAAVLAGVRQALVKVLVTAEGKEEKTVSFTSYFK